jgi:hypothetical protein
MPVREELFEKYDVPAVDSSDVEAPDPNQVSKEQSVP